MKDFIILGPKNAIGYKLIFPLLKNGDVKIGITQPSFFSDKDGGEVSAPSLWFNTMGVTKEPLPQTEKYSPEKYRKYDEMDAINCDRVKDIPCDYYGLIGVPMTYLCRVYLSPCRS